MKLRIFVIDDEECITYTMRLHLEELGHEVLTAPDPTLCPVYQGGMCDHDHVCGDIFFVDRHMPRMDGLTFIELMERRGCKGLTRNKVIMSGALTQEDLDRAKKLGCTALGKPVPLDEITRLIEEMEKSVPADRKLADLSGI
jgi:CheY-like chemotaxis protein